MKNEIVLADFFSGCGGTAHGFYQAGILPKVAVEWEADAASSYRTNFPETNVMERDIHEVDVNEVKAALDPWHNSVKLFAGCAPCQPFSTYRNDPTHKDQRAFLLLEFLRFVRALNPELIFVENVPGLNKKIATHGPFAEFKAELSKSYSVDHAVVSSADYGVPQQRHRLILLASRLGPISIPRPTHGPKTNKPYTTVRDWIASLPKLVEGQENSEVSSHKAMRLSRLNLERIRATPEGGDRRNWPKHLWPNCHLNLNGYTDVYGRLSWDKPAPTLTTRCISYTNGRYGHPCEDRALSVREAARLQTFPNEFKFVGGLTSQAQQIGNAVPVLLAEYFGRHLINHVMCAASSQICE